MRKFDLYFEFVCDGGMQHLCGILALLQLPVVTKTQQYRCMTSNHSILYTHPSTDKCCECLVGIW